MKLNHFALHQGKIVYVPDVPKEPITIPCNYKGTASPCTCAAEAFSRKANIDVVYYYDDNCPHRYKQALQSAIDNGIEVENQDEVEDKLLVIHEHHNGFKLQSGKLYPLHCRVEVIDEWIPGKGYNSPSKEIARVTFDEQQERKQCGVCWGGGKIEIDDLGNEENCISCNGTGVIEPEAAGQEQDKREVMDNLIHEHLHRFSENNLFRASLDHFRETGKASGSFRAALHAMMEEYKKL